MSKNDNSFERQLLDFYGIDKISLILNKMSDKTSLKDVALTQIGFDIALKLTGISKEEMERNKNILQIELYAQLERDRNNKSTNNSVDNLTWVEKQNGN